MLWQEKERDSSCPRVVPEYLGREQTNKQTQRNLAGHPHIWAATIPWTCPVWPVEMSRHRGHSVQPMWNYTNQVGTSRMSGDSPPNRAWDTSEAYRNRPPRSLMCSLFIGFFSLSIIRCLRSISFIWFISQSFGVESYCRSP